MYTCNRVITYSCVKLTFTINVALQFTYESVMKKIEDCRRVRSMVKLQEEQRSLLPSTLR